MINHILKIISTIKVRGIDPSVYSRGYSHSCFSLVSRQVILSGINATERLRYELHVCKCISTVTSSQWKKKLMSQTDSSVLLSYLPLHTVYHKFCDSQWLSFCQMAWFPLTCTALYPTLTEARSHAENVNNIKRDHRASTQLPEQHKTALE